MNQPFYALVCWFEKEIRTEASEEERDAGVQLLVHFSGLNASLQCQRCATEQCLLKLQEGRFNSQKLLQSCAACGRKGGWGLQKEARHATSDVTRLQMICRIYPWHRKCSCPWWQHLEGQREEKQPLCGSARLGHTEAVQASLADGPMTSW